MGMRWFLLLLAFGVVGGCPLLTAGCTNLRDPVALCPRCGPVGDGRSLWVALEPGHASPETTGKPGFRLVGVCPACDEVVDPFCTDEESGLLVPGLVFCEASGQVVATRRDPDFPWDYVCPDCGRPAFRSEGVER